MKHIYLFILAALVSLEAFGQVKSNYIYSTSTPYGTLDLRTRISSSHYYYVTEGKTFSYRESSPGVKTNKFLKMTSFDSSPYKEGHLRVKNGTADKFVMNYRMLMPNNYNPNYSQGYPLILILHGAVERGNCYYNTCYHSTWSYDPNVNNPKAPTTSTHKLLNNDHNLAQGGKIHLDARNLAGTKLPNDPTLPARAFPGFVIVPQMFNIWDSLNVQDAVRIVQLIQQKYKIDPNRIYVHGLSIGGFAVYQTIKRAHWLFAAALPMSAVHDANIVRQGQQPKVAPIPMWVFQGGKDTSPTPAYTNSLVTNLRNAGAVINYTVYADVGHTCWHKAFAEPNFFKWMLSQNKANITPAKGNTVINASKGIYPKLMVGEGFFAYQWEKDGVIISGASTNTYIAKAAGTYRVRFSRIANPTSTQWNQWSNPVKVTTGTTATSARIASNADSTVVEDLNTEETAEFSASVFPNPGKSEEMTIIVRSAEENTPIAVQMLDPTGKNIYDHTDSPSIWKDGIKPALPKGLTQGIYILAIKQGPRTFRQKVIIVR